MANEVYKLDNTNPNAGDQIDSTLAKLREKCHDGKFVWAAETVKGDKDDGSLRFTLEIGAKPVPVAPPDVQG